MVGRDWWGLIWLDIYVGYRESHLLPPSIIQCRPFISGIDLLSHSIQIAGSKLGMLVGPMWDPLVVMFRAVFTSWPCLLCRFHPKANFQDGNFSGRGYTVYSYRGLLRNLQTIFYCLRDITIRVNMTLYSCHKNHRSILKSELTYT